MSLPSKGKIAALDVGTRRTGLAVSDASQIVAFPRDDINHFSQEELIELVTLLVDKEDIVGLILGLPMSMGGDILSQAEMVQGTADILKKELSLPVILMDERLTSYQASLQKSQNSSQLNSHSAQILLETYLASNTEIPGNDLP